MNTCDLNSFSLFINMILACGPQPTFLYSMFSAILYRTDFVQSTAEAALDGSSWIALDGFQGGFTLICFLSPLAFQFRSSRRSSSLGSIVD